MLDFSKISGDVISSLAHGGLTVSAKNRTLIAKNQKGGSYTAYEDGEVLVTGKWTTSQLTIINNLTASCGE